MSINDVPHGVQSLQTDKPTTAGVAIDDMSTDAEILEDGGLCVSKSWKIIGTFYNEPM